MLEVLTQKMALLHEQIRVLNAFEASKMPQFYAGHGINVLCELRSAAETYKLYKMEMQQELASMEQTPQRRDVD